MKLRTGRSFRQKSIKQPIVENDRWKTLQNILERGGNQTAETDLSYQLMGVYSLPEFWGKLVESGSVNEWNFTIKLCGAVLGEGKYNPRELTEEEKKELDTKKKPAPKINKKDPAAVKAEEDRIAAEQKEKEEKEKAFQDELNKLTPEEQFYYIKEMPTKEAWVSWKEDNCVASIKINGDKLVELDRDVNIEEGTILELSFIPPPDEDPKKRPKPKGITPEEVQPVFCVAWIDFTNLHKTSGLTELTLRANLLLKETYEKRIDEYEKKTGKKILNPNFEEIMKIVKENEEENLDYVEKAKSYVYIKIGLTIPVNPLLPDIDLPNPDDYMRKEKLPPKPYTIEQIEQDLLRQFKIAIAAIAKTYDEALGCSAKNQLIRSDKGNLISNAKREERENIINKFLDKFNTSGRADLLKEKLKKFIVKIVREKYNKKNTSVKGVYKDQRDQFYSELYAYLTDTVKTATDEFLALKEDELHEYILSSYAQSKKEIMNYAIRKNNEPEDERLLRLSQENELNDNYNEALKIFKQRLILNPSKESWMAYAKMAKKIGIVEEFESGFLNAMSNATEEELKDLNLKVIFAGLEYSKENLKNAMAFLTLYIEKYELQNTNHIFNAFLAFLYKEKMNQPSVQQNKASLQACELLFNKYLEYAKLLKMKEIPKEELKPKPEPEPVEEENDKKKDDKKKDKNAPVVDPEEEAKLQAERDAYGNPRIHSDYKPPVLNQIQTDLIWFDCINLFNSYCFYDISEKLLNFISEETKNQISFKLEQARIYLFRKNYEKVENLCSEIIKEDSYNYDAYILLGNSLYYQEKYQESIDSFIKSIRYKPQKKQFDLEMLTKLGKIYINQKEWFDAKVIFTNILKICPNFSFAWKFLGLTLTKLGEFEEAEKALSKANLFDVENASIWANMIIFCLNTGKIKQAVECLNELNRVNYSDEKSLEEIAEMFFNLNEFEISANVYKKIIKINYNRTDIYLKIADIYFNHLLDKKYEALEFLKNNMNLVDEEKKKEIEDAYNKYNKEMECLLTGENDNNENDNNEQHENKMETEEFNIDESQIKKNADFMEDEEEKHENKNENEEEKNENKNENEEEKKEEMILEPEEKP